MPTSKDNIYIKTWLSLKPYGSAQATDMYYLRLCNEVKKIILKSRYINFFEDLLSSKELDQMCCFLVSYFEDLISGSNLWPTFIKLSKELYNKPLPFYTIYGYIDEEINREDIWFLIWYYLSSVDQDTLISPHAEPIISIGDAIFDILDKHWEYAPENEKIGAYYKFDSDVENYYELRVTMQTLLLGSYLFAPDVGLQFEISVKDLMAESRDDPNLVEYLSEHQDSLCWKVRTKLLALSGQEWLAEVNGRDHSLYHDIINIPPKVTSFFQYKHATEECIYVEHVASGKEFEVDSESLAHVNNLLDNEDSIFYMGLVRWKERWCLSGAMCGFDFNANLILDEKNSIESYAAVQFLDEDSDRVNETLNRHQQAFLKFNDNKSIAFVEQSEIKNFVEGFHKVATNSLKLTQDQKLAAHKRIRAKGFTRVVDDIELDFDPEAGEGAVVFYNPLSGIELAMGVSSAFPDEDNPYFTPTLCDREVLQLICSPHYSTQLVHYCIDTYGPHLHILKKSGLKFLKDELDFVLRFWKTERYYTRTIGMLHL